MSGEAERRGGLREQGLVRREDLRSRREEGMLVRREGSTRRENCSRNSSIVSHASQVQCKFFG